MRLFYLYAVLTILNIVFLSLIYIFFPSLRMDFIKEDHFLENLTAGVFLVGFILGLFFVLRLKEGSRRTENMLIPVVALFCFLEEVSFGVRFFKITVPSIKKVSIDALHDFVLLIFVTLKNSANYLLYIVAVALIVIFGFLMLRYGERFARVRGLFQKYIAYKFLLISVLFMLTASVIDLYIAKLVLSHEIHVSEFADKMFIYPTRYRVLYFAEELLEMNSALALLFASLSMASTKP